MSVAFGVLGSMVGFFLGGDWTHYSLLLLAALVGWKALRSP